MAAWQAIPTDRSGSVAVDPRPIAIHDHGALPESSSYHPDRETGARWLASRLTSMGIESVRVVPLRSDCSGVLVPGPYKDTDGCPSTPESEFAFDIARPEGDGSLWAVRMLELTYGPGGRSATLFRVVLNRTETGFELRSKEALVAFD